MRGRTWLILSLGLNLVLAADFLFTHVKPKPAPPPKLALKKPFNPFDFYVRTNIVVRKQNFTWHEVESSDYGAYIKNLRTIGCPEQTIRDIIIADVNQLYAHRRAEETATNDFEWWRSEGDTNQVQEAFAKMRTLEEERRALLTRLLGPGWDKTTDTVVATAKTGINLAGPVLGQLSPQVKLRVQEIAAQAQKYREAYLDSQRQLGLPADPAELLRLRQQTRAQLETILTPEQLEEYLLRYSETAAAMRRDFRGLSLTPDEFRQIFRARDPLEQALAQAQTESGPAPARRAAELQGDIEDALRNAIGPERYAAFKLSQDPLFRESKATAERVGASPEVMLSIYEINRETDAERRRIRNDNSLSSQQKIDALAAAQAEQQKSLQTLLGEAAYQKLSDLQENKP